MRLGEKGRPAAEERAGEHADHRADRQPHPPARVLAAHRDRDDREPDRHADGRRDRHALEHGARERALGLDLARQPGLEALEGGRVAGRDLGFHGILLVGAARG